MVTCAECGKQTPDGKFCSFCGAKLAALAAAKEEIISHTVKGPDGVEMVLIPAGEYWMGSPELQGRPDEHPQHLVWVDPFYLDKYPVTFDQYDKFCEATNRQKPDDNRWGREDLPVIGVSWNDANAFCKWAGKRLPTEAEWEKACRAGTKTVYFFGNDFTELGEYGWFDANSKRTTHPVGKKVPNAYGLHDMSGNVWEWCADWYDVGYYARSPKSNPTGPDTGQTKVLRGGAWRYNAFSSRSASRFRSEPAIPTGDCFGFRCAKTP